MNAHIRIWHTYTHTHTCLTELFIKVYFRNCLIKHRKCVLLLYKCKVKTPSNVSNFHVSRCDHQILSRQLQNHSRSKRDLYDIQTKSQTGAKRCITRELHVDRARMADDTFVALTFTSVFKITPYSHVEPHFHNHVIRHIEVEIPVFCVTDCSKLQKKTFCHTVGNVSFQDMIQYPLDTTYMIVCFLSITVFFLC